MKFMAAASAEDIVDDENDDEDDDEDDIDRFLVRSNSDPGKKGRLFTRSPS